MKTEIIKVEDLKLNNYYIENYDGYINIIKIEKIGNELATFKNLDVSLKYYYNSCKFDSIKHIVTDLYEIENVYRSILSEWEHLNNAYNIMIRNIISSIVSFQNRNYSASEVLGKDLNMGDVLIDSYTIFLSSDITEENNFYSFIDINDLSSPKWIANFNPSDYYKIETNKDIIRSIYQMVFDKMQKETAYRYEMLCFILEGLLNLYKKFPKINKN